MPDFHLSFISRAGLDPAALKISASGDHPPPASTFPSVPMSGTDHCSYARLCPARPTSSTEGQVSLWVWSPMGLGETVGKEGHCSLGLGKSAGMFDLGDPEVWFGMVLLGNDC